jgi:hypothetical protein
MIQQGDTVGYGDLKAVVLKVHPRSNYAQISVNGEIKEVPYSSLNRINTNKFTPRKTPAEMLKDVAVDIQELHQFAQENAKDLETGYCTMNMQIQANIHKLYEKKLNDILNRK